MQITRQADYAVRAVLYLAGLGPGARAATAQIANEQKIPATFLAKIVSQLSAAGLLRAVRGAHGGVMLARPPQEISLLEIVEVIDGPVTLNQCTSDPAECPSAKPVRCATSGVRRRRTWSSGWPKRSSDN